MAPIYKIAIIQLQPKALAVQDNFTRAVGFLREAAAAGVHLAVLPEYHLTAWVPAEPGFVAACTEAAACLPRYQALARELKMNIVPGTSCFTGPSLHDTGDGQKMSNMAHFISDTGVILSAYQKKNLWHPERVCLLPGKAPHAAFDTPLQWEPEGDPSSQPRPIRAGLLICWDLAYPEAFRQLVADGADLIIIPSYWYLSDMSSEGRALNPDSERLFLDSVVVGRAFENTCAVVLCNTGGFSQVALPITGALGEKALLPDCESMRVVEVDFGILRLAESNYQIRADMRSRGWKYEP